MKTVDVFCDFCEKLVTKPLKEYTRSLKRGRKFYCSISCAIKKRNEPYKALVVEKVCLNCKKLFTSTTKKEGS